MKNPFQPKRIPILAFFAGGLGFLLRVWLFATGVDNKGLIIETHPANILIYILTAVTLVGLYLCIRPMSGMPAYKRLFKHNQITAAGCALTALGVLISSFEHLTQAQGFIAVVAFLFGLGAAGCLVMLGYCNLRGARPNVLLHGGVCAYLILRLIAQYRFWSSEPVLQEYIFQLLATVFLMLSVYHRTTLDALCGNRPLFVFFHYGALFFSCLALYSQSWLFFLSMILWTGTCQCSLKPVREALSMRLPKNVHYCLRALEDRGFSAYVVGGCVRDALLGLTPHDYDMCTSATPEQVAKVFSQHALVRSGEKHGTIGVVIKGEVYEITTFRSEGGYSDNRHPDWVEFVTSLETDLSRRDFTVNAIAYSPSHSFIDPFGGQADLENKILRTVGEPEARFQEDSLRILRGVRFAARFGLVPEEATEKAMISLAPLMENLAPERIFSEICKLIVHVSAEDLIRFAPVLAQAIPELAPMIGFDQCSPHHAFDVYTHTAHVVAATEEQLPLRLAALLHDIGKPATFTQDENGRGHFHSHAKVGAEMANEILMRLRAPNALRNQVVFLIEQHMTLFEPDKRVLRRRLGKYGYEGVAQLLALQKADYMSKGVVDDVKPDFSQVEELLAQIRQEEACLTVKDLAINGSDVLELGVEPGRQIGECMAFLLGLVQDELINNTREDLLNSAKDYFNLN